VKGALLVAGTTSDAGKSMITAGLCRWLWRQGVKVAPFKAQNMSLNSFVTAAGAEIGRAQAMQAAAAGIEPEARMNPVLLKPGSDRRTQIVLLGHRVADVDAVEYRDWKARLLEVALNSLAQLRSEYDVVICEGAGSPAEINLRDTDIANMGLARAAGLPVIVVGDIDRGGVFAAMHGTLALLDAADQQLIAGFVINKFRGAPELLDSGLAMLRGLTGRAVYGVVPFSDGLWLDAEDSLSLSPGRRAGPVQPLGSDVLRVSVIRLPRISNVTDVDALSAEPGVIIRFATTPAELADADLVVLPGTKATVSDLAWLRERGLADAITRRAACGLPVLGICGGYQMLGRVIDDPVESGAGPVPGLGLLPVRVSFGQDKQLARPAGEAYGAPVDGYEIHHGIAAVEDCAVAGDNGAAAEPFLDGCRAGSVWGTSWHGSLESDAFRRSFLADVAEVAGRDFVAAPDLSFAAVRQAHLDLMGDLVAAHLDTGALSELIACGPPAGLRVIPPAGAVPA
jgi:adenosylcobyric acid synthase